MSEKPEQSKKRSGITGVAVPAGLFIGMGIGFVVDNVTAGIFLGLGCGFLGMIILRIITGEW